MTCWVSVCPLVTSVSCLVKSQADGVLFSFQSAPLFFFNVIRKSGRRGSIDIRPYVTHMWIFIGFLDWLANNCLPIKNKPDVIFVTGSTMTHMWFPLSLKKQKKYFASEGESRKKTADWRRNGSHLELGRVSLTFDPRWPTSSATRWRIFFNQNKSF